MVTFERVIHLIVADKVKYFQFLMKMAKKNKKVGGIGVRPTEHDEAGVGHKLRQGHFFTACVIFFLI